MFKVFVFANQKLQQYMKNYTLKSGVKVSAEGTIDVVPSQQNAAKDCNKRRN